MTDKKVVLPKKLRVEAGGHNLFLMKNTNYVTIERRVDHKPLLQFVIHLLELVVKSISLCIES